ncbi:peroxiredoxin [Gordonia neofelifaecis]|uniref:Alkyl hydroperoxide reductase E n=1 Tax=Gordonia neofelifaecis NRRL B-59395 TaxID=644548 RepID=F1YHC5_9ACTN|nr:peroxiredoxin [Gordonia neofelifaecis]EGD55763.1 alkyl hydroperoxide reductase/ Thiol specific antioxidant/ Mal allergen [Gordonia neofelifaecis NRRL B-59395]
MTAQSVAGPIEIGSRAPDFELRDQNNQVVRLSDLRDRDVLIVFFPLAFTGTCEGELGFLRDNLPRFDNDYVTVVAVSVGPPPTHKVWSSAQGFLFPILADFWPHGAVADAYGVFDVERGFPNRGTFVVGRDGTVKFSAMVGPGEQRGDETWDAALAVVGH